MAFALDYKVYKIIFIKTRASTGFLSSCASTISGLFCSNLAIFFLPYW